MGVWDALGRGIESGVNNAMKINDKKDEKAYRDKLFNLNETQSAKDNSYRELKAINDTWDTADALDHNKNILEETIRHNKAIEGTDRYRASIMNRNNGLKEKKDESFINGVINPDAVIGITSKMGGESLGITWGQLPGLYASDPEKYGTIVDEAYNTIIASVPGEYKEGAKEQLDTFYKTAIPSYIPRKELLARKAEAEAEAERLKAERKAAALAKKEERYNKLVDTAGAMDYGTVPSVNAVPEVTPYKGVWGEFASRWKKAKPRMASK